MAGIIVIIFMICLNTVVLSAPQELLRGSVLHNNETGNALYQVQLSFEDGHLASKGSSSILGGGSGSLCVGPDGINVDIHILQQVPDHYLDRRTC